ncbi:MAG: hypothetical protein NDJ89_08515 [Oligoflexia bacterium]|nr:hypothetical protein [Oligoflexia bacterium]
MKTLPLFALFLSSSVLAAPAPNFESAPVELRTCDARVSVEAYRGRHDTGVFLTVGSGEYRGRYEFKGQNPREPMSSENLRMNALIATSKTGEAYCYQIRLRPDGSGLARTPVVFDLVTFFERE